MLAGPFLPFLPLTRHFLITSFTSQRALKLFPSPGLVTTFHTLSAYIRQSPPWWLLLKPSIPASAWDTQREPSPQARQSPCKTRKFVPVRTNTTGGRCCKITAVRDQETKPNPERKKGTPYQTPVWLHFPPRLSGILTLKSV